MPGVGKVKPGFGDVDDEGVAPLTVQAQELTPSTVLGRAEGDMAELDSRQNPTDFVDFEGKFWLYRFSREMGVFSEGHGTGRGFYAWQFAEQDGKLFLAIRKFQGEPFVANIWIKVEPADVTVFRGN